MISAHVVGADVASASFLASASTVGPKTNAIRRTYSHLLVGMVQARAPRRRGHYASTIGVDEDGNVGSDDPASARHEFGFHGVDSRGHHYNQGPHAHYGPGADAIDGPFVGALEAMVDTL